MEGSRGSIFSDITRKFVPFYTDKKCKSKRRLVSCYDAIDIAFHIANRIILHGMFCSVINSLSPPLLLPISLSLSLHSKSDMSPKWGTVIPFSCRVLTPSLNNALDNMNMLAILFLSATQGGARMAKGGGGRHSTQRMQRQQMTTRQKLSKKVFHQCLRCEFISHADVLDRKPLPGGASSSCSCCLPGLAQSTTVRTSQRVRLLPHRANTN